MSERVTVLHRRVGSKEGKWQKTAEFAILYLVGRPALTY